MVKVEEATQVVLDKISEGFTQKGAFNLRQNGISICHGDSEHIKIKKKEDKPGIDIFIDGETKGEKVFIPVVVSVSGMTDLVYNDFYVADGADVDIVAGCGIHNSGCNDSRHDGIHTFHVGKNANVHYEEKHYGEGNGTGSRVLNPVTNIELGENSVFTLDTVQIKGVDSNRQGCLHQGLHLIFTHLTDPHHPKDNRGQTLIFSKLNIVHVRLLFCSSIVLKRLAKVNLKSKREWDRNRSFVRIRFRRPTSAQLSRAVKADEISVVEPTQPLRLARQSKNN